MASVLMAPPGDGRHGSVPVNGRRYTCAVGSTLTVPDFDADGLAANGWIRLSSELAGTTAQRPAAPRKGHRYLDTTVGGEVVWDGVAWRHHATGAAV